MTSRYSIYTVHLPCVLSVHHFHMFRYEAKLEHTVIPGKRNQLIFGLSLAFVYMIMYLMYALAFWYGAKLTGQQTNTPADILIAFFNVLIGRVEPLSI